MWELDCEENWVPKNWCFWTVVLEKTLESPLDCEEIQPVHSKGDQSWVFFGRTDAKAETLILWPPHAKSWLIGKECDAGRDWGQEEKGTTEWDGWMASVTRWTWVWVNSGSLWWTGRSGVLRFMGSQRVRHDWATELTELSISLYMCTASSSFIWRYYLYWKASRLCLHSGKTHCHCFPRLLTLQIFLERYSGTTCVSASIYRKYRNVEDLWRTVSNNIFG